MTTINKVKLHHEKPKTDTRSLVKSKVLTHSSILKPRIKICSLTHTFIAYNIPLSKSLHNIVTSRIADQ